LFIFAAVSVSLNDGNYVGFLGYAMIKSVNNERSNVLVGMEDVLLDGSRTDRSTRFWEYRSSVLNFSTNVSTTAEEWDLHRTDESGSALKSACGDGHTRISSILNDQLVPMNSTAPIRAYTTHSCPLCPHYGFLGSLTHSFKRGSTILDTFWKR